MVPGLFKLPENLWKTGNASKFYIVFGVACVVTAVVCVVTAVVCVVTAVACVVTAVVCCGVRDAVGITRGIGSIAVLPRRRLRCCLSCPCGLRHHRCRRGGGCGAVFLVKRLIFLRTTERSMEPTVSSVISPLVSI